MSPKWIGNRLFTEPIRVAATWGVVKGIAIVSLLAALDVSFIHQLIIAFVSGALGAVGVIVGAYVATRENRKNRDLIHEVKEKLDEKPNGKSDPPKD